MLSFCTFTLQILQCYQIIISSQWCEHHEHMWKIVNRIRFKGAQAQHGHENIPLETCKLHWCDHFFCLEKVKGGIKAAFSMPHVLIFDRVWPSKNSSMSFHLYMRGLFFYQHATFFEEANSVRFQLIGPGAGNASNYCNPSTTQKHIHSASN